MDSDVQLTDKIINVWSLIYDGSSEQSYNFSCYNKALASIEGSLKTIINDESEEADMVIKCCIEKIASLSNQPVVPIQFGELTIALHKLSIDKCNEIHKVLLACHAQVADQDLKQRIERLFVEA
jgi:hypothetical protein